MDTRGAGPDARPDGSIDLTEAPPSEEPAAAAGPDLSRRGFVVRALAAVGGGFAAALAIPVGGFASAPGWRASEPVKLLETSVPPTLRSNEWTSIGRLTDFEVGVPKYTVVQRQIVDGWVREQQPVGVYVVRRSDTGAVVFDPHCTHLGCPLSSMGGAQSFVCPCHGGSFDVDGDVTSGPPPHPMFRYETKIEGGTILIGALRQGA